MMNLEIFNIQLDFLNFQNHSENYFRSEMIIPNITKKAIIGQSRIYSNLPEKKNAIKNRKN
jgi:hypothetical protein